VGWGLKGDIGRSLKEVYDSTDLFPAVSYKERNSALQRFHSFRSFVRHFSQPLVVRHVAFFFCIPGTNSCASSSFQNRPCITVSRSHVPSPTVATLHLPGPYLISGGCTAMICPAFSGCECPRSGAVSLRSFGDGCYSV
jgi:hypothetical protein